MSKKSMKKASGKTTAKATTAAKTDQPAQPKKMSILDAAAQVLAKAGTENTAAMVKAMLEKGIWSTAGKTPAATLHAAVSREIAAKGDASRFRKSVGACSPSPAVMGISARKEPFDRGKTIKGRHIATFRWLAGLAAYGNRGKD